MIDKTKGNNTSDINLAAFLAYHGTKMLGTSSTSENGRVRVWFNFDIDENEFSKLKNDFFSQAEESRVIAQKLFQERDRMYALMIQVRNSAKNSAEQGG